MIRHLTRQDLVAAQAGNRNLAQLISLIENPNSTPPYLLTGVEARTLNNCIAYVNSTIPDLLTGVEARMLNPEVAQHNRNIGRLQALRMLRGLDGFNPATIRKITMNMVAQCLYTQFEEGFRIQYNCQYGTGNTTFPGTFKWNTLSLRWETLIPGQGTHYINPHPSGVGGYTVQNTTTQSLYQGCMFFFGNTVFI
tara:strand:+ start:150 stop:734 length:585 start_codon:yes stop_codon:yes gene_type:complete